jgi:transposase
MLSPAHLPNDIAALKALLLAQDEVLEGLREQLNTRAVEIEHLKLQIAKLRRMQFGRKSEKLDHQIEQLELQLEDLQADEAEAAREMPAADQAPRKKSVRRPLPEHLPRDEKVYAPTADACPACGGGLRPLGEDVAEQLEFVPASFRVIRHVRPKLACSCCDAIVQAPAPSRPIERGIAGPGLLAHILVAKFADHLPLYRQEKIFGRAGLPIARSTLAQWVGNCGVQLQPLVDALREAVLTHGVVHADETPVQMLTPGAKKTHRAYVWAYATSQFSDLAAVVYDFSPSRAGEHARNFLGNWNGKLVCDDFAGYKAGFELGVTEIGCMAHARRKFFDLHATNKSQIAEKALHYIAALYEVEREAHELEPGVRQRIRQEKAAPIIDALHTWMIAQRQLVPEGSAIAKALDYSLKRWIALTRYLDDGAVPIDNNWCENQIRPWALGRSNWLFAGSLRSGKRAAAIMSLIQSARLNGHDPYAYLKDVLARLPTHRAREITELLPHNWTPA